ncbi:Uncharacterized sufE-like protein ygdK [Raoultella terrigena]|uniref:Uncharacterized sufE-like protein ygdK n=1 Tax=Raoultella terrigena TaxID=577 RepID=A0A4U9D0Y8_RAOTE|nr:Uncharacterized sufE-like protein ygdK [Raoultella terrigena]
MLLTAVEGKSAAELQARDPLALFDELGLRAQLSASRGQGLAALGAAVLARGPRGLTRATAPGLTPGFRQHFLQRMRYRRQNQRWR